jgi:hypothetical protein
MDRLRTDGHFQPPCIESLEEVLEFGVALKRGRVFADLWDIEKLYRCMACGPARAHRLAALNQAQTIPPSVRCPDPSCRLRLGGP